MNALVIAGNSFVGRHLCRRLRDGGASVVATGRGQEAGSCDVGDGEGVRELFRRVAPDCVFQCAAATAQDATAEEMYRVHVTGALNVLRAAAEFAPDTALVFLGSAAEYGAVSEANLPVNEDHPLRPASLFGASKAAQTQLALAAAVEWNLRVIVARPFNVLGPGLPDRYLAAALANRLLQEGATGRLLSVANPDASRDFVDVRDVAEALVALVERAAPRPGEPGVFNIASGREVTVMDVARKLCEWHGGRAVSAQRPASSRSGIGRSCGDASRLRAATDWRPRVGWEQSMREMWDILRAGETAREPAA
jgi:GDP-4-dehydro-6-deoxy-D-mannose reductase